MKIDLHNYEAFFLDYREGNLDAQRVEELFAFLEEYPQLKAELDSYEEIVLEEESVFVAKHSLKKQEFNNDSLIAYTEGLLSAGEKRNIEQLASENTGFNKELSYYKSAKVSADLSIKIPAKNKLKRGGVVIYLQSNSVVLRVAAALLLIFGLYFLVSSLQTEVTAVEKKSSYAAVKKNSIGVNNNSEQLSKQENFAEVKTLATKNDQHKKIRNVSTNNTSKLNPEKNNQPEIAPDNTVTIAENNTPKNDSRDSVFTDPVVVNSTQTATQEAYKSYVNISKDNDDEEANTVTASAVPSKKTFFGRLTNAAKKVNGFGVKTVNGEEDDDRKSISIGGFVVSESSN